MLRYLFFIILFFTTLSIQGQQVLVKHIASEDFQADRYFGKDALGYDYYLKNYTLYKRQGKEFFEYKNILLGTVTSVDVINPLKILVFYKDFNTVILLDNNLSEISQIPLNRFGITAQGCTMASSNRLWIYDALGNQLILLDYHTGKSLVLGQPFRENTLAFFSDYNYWYRIASDKNIYTYDNYGRVIQKRFSEAYDQIQVSDFGKVFFSLKDNLYLYQDLEQEPLWLLRSDEPIIGFDVRNNILNLRTENKLTSYTLKLP